MSLPEAEILPFDDGQTRPTPYEELDHVKITKAFLNDPPSSCVIFRDGQRIRRLRRFHRFEICVNLRNLRTSFFIPLSCRASRARR